jgi:hypothetical protein
MAAETSQPEQLLVIHAVEMGLARVEFRRPYPLTGPRSTEQAVLFNSFVELDEVKVEGQPALRSVLYHQVYGEEQPPERRLISEFNRGQAVIARRLGRKLMVSKGWVERMRAAGLTSDNNEDTNP